MLVATGFSTIELRCFKINKYINRRISRMGRTQCVLRRNNSGKCLAARWMWQRTTPRPLVLRVGLFESTFHPQSCTLVPRATARAFTVVRVSIPALILCVIAIISSRTAR